VVDALVPPDWVRFARLAPWAEVSILEVSVSGERAVK